MQYVTMATPTERMNVEIKRIPAFNTVLHLTYASFQWAILLLGDAFHMFIS